ncbi:putative quinol monooxygenase [Ammoniphilus sp. YIM 78166]|uniref:putative quinol monooxygenase n=1 Tax=Ammoniphilus sp. YIM 78166 TaxID=1644106 RepID=UPI00106F20B3|nr:putative quinol monooxygenase [Ammoniphilus sp. YIM 78166]
MPSNINKQIVFTVKLQAKQGKEQELEDALADMVAKVQDEEGALVYTLHRIQGSAGGFMFYEKYKDQAALDFHDSTPYVKELLIRLEDLVDEELQFSQLEEIAAISR